MHFFHLSDLHIGKQLYGYSLLEDQEWILTEIYELIREKRPDGVLIAGDVYDKSVPAAEAVTVFDRFLTKVSQLEPKIPVLIISGNHDSPERLAFGMDASVCETRICAKTNGREQKGNRQRGRSRRTKRPRRGNRDKSEKRMGRDTQGL